MKFKVFTLSVLISALISTSAFAAINITVDNKPLTTDVSPVIIDGRTLVPVRSIFEELGADVIWNNETKTVSATLSLIHIFIIKQAREMGITAVIAAGDTWENATIIENAGADAEGTVFSTFYDEAAPANDEAAAFVDGFKAYLTGIGESDIIPAVSALGYDAYITAVQAIDVYKRQE